MIKNITAGYSSSTILVLALTVAIVGAVMGAGTLAYFQDTDVSSSNTIQSGTLNVTIDGVDDGTTSDFSMTNSTPLSSTTKNYSIRNAGSTSANHLQINFSFTENDPTGTYEAEPGDSDLNKPLDAANTSKYIEVTTLTYHNGTSSNNLLSSIGDGNGNGIVDLADIQNHSVMDDLTPPDQKEGSITYFEITVRVASDQHGLVDNDEDIMGDGIDVKVHFTLMQDSSQD